MPGFIVIALLGACGQAGDESAGRTGPAPPAASPAERAHSSRNALDWDGEYRGVLACEDCDGVETTIVLTRYGRYQRSRRPLGPPADQEIDAGRFSWGERGAVITLHTDHLPAPRFQVGEGVLFLIGGGCDGLRSRDVYGCRFEQLR